MLNDKQKEILSDALTPLYDYLEAQVIADVAARIQKSLAYTRTAELEVIALQRLGYSPAKIRSEVMRRLRADKEFQKLVEQNTLEYKRQVRDLLIDIRGQAMAAGEEIITDAVDMSWADDLSLWDSAGKDLNTGSRLSQLKEAFTRQTAGELKNLTKTTGFKTMNGFEPVENLYRTELDKALVKMSSGAFTADQCIRDLVKDLSKSGIRTIDYTSGRTYQLDTAARMCLRTASNQISAHVMDTNLRETKESMVQVSAHWGARNKGTGIANHEEWQGKIYYTDGAPRPEEEKRIGQKIYDLKEKTGYDVQTGIGTVDGLHGINCRHQHYVFFEGISKPVEYPPEPAPKVINGKTYDYYAMTQQQRKMEREIRALKREKEALQACNMDTKEVRAKIKRKIEEYKEFSDKCGISAKMNRIRVESGTSDLTKTQAWQQYKSSVDKNLDFGNLKGVKFRMNADKTNIQSQDVETIKNTISNLSKEYHIKLDEFEIRDFSGKKFRYTPMFYRATEDDGKYISKLVINNSCEFWYNQEIRSTIIEKNYFAGNTVEQFVEHEIAHVMTFQGCKTFAEVESLADMLQNKYTDGLSQYNRAARDGAETIAEAFVLKRKGVPINSNAEKLLNKYVEVYKK